MTHTHTRTLTHTHTHNLHVFLSACKFTVSLQTTSQHLGNGKGSKFCIQQVLWLPIPAPPAQDNADFLERGEQEHKFNSYVTFYHIYWGEKIHVIIILI